MSDAGLDALNNAEGIGDGSNADAAPVGNDAPDSGGHPAWQEILGVIPDSLHPVVTPALQKWDQGVQERFKQVQSQYDPYKPFVEQQLSPDDIQRAMHVSRLIETDPKRFYEQMGQFYKFGTQGDQGQQPNSDDEDVYDLSGQENTPDPTISKLEQQQQIIAQGLYELHRERTEAEEDAALASEMDRLKAEHGEFDEGFVLKLAAVDGNLEGAVQQYMQIVTRARGQQAPGANLPPVVSPSGATPSTAINPAELGRSETKSLVANMLAQLNGQQQN